MTDTYEVFKDISYLVSCELNGEAPSKERVSSMDLDLLYRSAELHQLSAISAMAVEDAGIFHDAFRQAKARAIRKSVLFSAERQTIFKRFDEEGIMYVPLKGSVLEKIYPSIGMRQMADNDIFIDPDRMDEIHKIMLSLGFRLDHDGEVHASYFKEPLYNFEMHKKLFASNADQDLYDYYLDVRHRLIRDGSGSGCHFSDEDFYIYMIAHEYKHYSNSGSGIRSLMDIYVYLKNKGGNLDNAYIKNELAKLKLSEFEESSRALAFDLFEGNELSDEEDEMFRYMISSGTYGTVGNSVRNKMNKYHPAVAKLRYVLSRIFLPLKTVKSAFPLFIKIPILLPFLPLYRIISALILRRNRVKAELKAVKDYKSRNSKEK